MTGLRDCALIDVHERGTGTGAIVPIGSPPTCCNALVRVIVT